MGCFRPQIFRHFLHHRSNSMQATLSHLFHSPPQTMLNHHSCRTRQHHTCSLSFTRILICPSHPSPNPIHHNPTRPIPTMVLLRLLTSAQNPAWRRAWVWYRSKTMTNCKTRPHSCLLPTQTHLTKIKVWSTRSWHNRRRGSPAVRQLLPLYPQTYCPSSPN